MKTQLEVFGIGEAYAEKHRFVVTCGVNWYAIGIYLDLTGTCPSLPWSARVQVLEGGIWRELTLGGMRATDAEGAVLEASAKISMREGVPLEAGRTDRDTRGPRGVG